MKLKNCCYVTTWNDTGELVNRMWFSVVCTLIDNDMYHHSVQSVVDLGGAAK